MKLLFIICVFWATASIEGVPEDYEQWLQPRSITDLPFFSWFYSGNTEDTHKEIDAPDSPHHNTDETNLNELELRKNSAKIQYLIEEDKSADTSPSNDKPTSIENVLKELHKILNNPAKLKLEDVSDNANDGQIRVIPVNEAGPNEKPEPIENLLADLKHEVNETEGEDKKNVMTLLTDLNKTMKETSTKLAKVFINKTWHVFDFGALGTTRRTRNMNETVSLLAPMYALLGLLTQLFGSLHLGGNNILDGSHGGNNIQGGGLLELLFPSSSQNSYLGTPANQKVIGGIAGLPGGHGNDSKNVYIICINNKNKEKANRLFHGNTSEDVISKIESYLDNNKLDTEEKFFIILKLHELFDRLVEKFDRLSEKDKESALKVIKLIILISEDPRFEQLFKIFKSKKDPEFDTIWELFKNKPKQNEKYLMIIRQLPPDKIIEHPSHDCFIVGPDGKIDGSGDDSDSDTDDNEKHSKSGKKDDLETYLMTITARGPKSKKDYYICCIDDDDELKAKQILDGKTNDKIIIEIEEKLKRNDLDTEYKWYIILRLYKMLKDIEKDEKDENDKDKREKDKDDKDKIIKLIVVIGGKPDFKPLFKNLKTKKDPRFREIWKLLQNESRDPEVEHKPQEKHKDPAEKDNKDPKIVQKNLSDITNPPVEDKVIKEDEESKKGNKFVLQPTPAPPPQPQVHISQRIADLSVPDISKINLSSWESQYDPILKEVEIKMKNPNLDHDAKWKIIDFIDKWYLAKFADPKVKSKCDGLVNMIKQDPQYDEVFDGIKRDNTPEVTKRVFDLFGKKDTNPSSNYIYSSKPLDPYTTYYWLDRFRLPTDDYEYAKLPLVEKTDLLITLYTLIYAPHLTLRDNINVSSELHRNELMTRTEKIVQANRKEFDDFENVFIPQIGRGYDTERLIRKLGDFKNYLLGIDTMADRTIYLKGVERRKMQDFINEQKASGLLPSE